jgi:hypothetical protein
MEVSMQFMHNLRCLLPNGYDENKKAIQELPTCGEWGTTLAYFGVGFLCAAVVGILAFWALGRFHDDLSDDWQAGLWVVAVSATVLTPLFWFVTLPGLLLLGLVMGALWLGSKQRQKALENAQERKRLERENAKLVKYIDRELGLEETRP